MNVEIIVAPGRSIEDAEIRRDAQGQVLDVITHNHGPGTSLKVDPDEAERLIAQGAAHRPGEAPFAGSISITPKPANETLVGLIG